MPRYHFNIDNGIGFIPDEEGQELPDLRAARTEAIRGIRSILAEDLLQGHLDMRGKLEIADEDGRILLTIAFAEAVEIRR